MSRKVSLWIVLILALALAAATATIVVQAVDDESTKAVADRAMPMGTQEEWHMPVDADGHRGWDEGHDGPLLPWLLFAIATGTSVGLLIAWGPWRRTPAPAAAGGGAPVTPDPDLVAAAPVETTVPVETAAPGETHPATDATAASIAETSVDVAAEPDEQDTSVAKE